MWRRGETQVRGVGRANKGLLYTFAIAGTLETHHRRQVHERCAHGARPRVDGAREAFKFALLALHRCHTRLHSMLAVAPLPLRSPKSPPKSLLPP